MVSRIILTSSARHSWGRTRSTHGSRIGCACASATAAATTSGGSSTAGLPRCIHSGLRYLALCLFPPFVAIAKRILQYVPDTFGRVEVLAGREDKRPIAAVVEACKPQELCHTISTIAKALAAECLPKPSTGAVDLAIFFICGICHQVVDDE